MRLYYMTTLETLEEFVLPEMRIRVSTFDTVNDPFELLAMSQGGGKTERDKFKWLYEYWVSTLGFVSLSDHWRSPLMWAHYAKNHTGVCIGLEVPDDRAMKVSYETERLQTVLDASKLETAVDDEIIRTVVTTKFKEWEYEREWRVLVRLQHPDPDTGLHYLEFSPDFELREIILGARCISATRDSEAGVWQHGRDRHEAGPPCFRKLQDGQTAACHLHDDQPPASAAKA